jgi:hypothetical protein
VDASVGASAHPGSEPRMTPAGPGRCRPGSLTPARVVRSQLAWASHWPGRVGRQEIGCRGVPARRRRPRVGPPRLGGRRERSRLRGSVHSIVANLVTTSVPLARGSFIRFRPQVSDQRLVAHLQRCSTELSDNNEEPRPKPGVALVTATGEAGSTPSVGLPPELGRGPPRAFGHRLELRPDHLLVAHP